MLLHGSIFYQFTGLLIAANTLTAKAASFPSYAEFYNTKAALAIADIGAEAGDLVSIASSRIEKRADRTDQQVQAAKKKNSYQSYEIPRDTLSKFELEDAYEGEIDALDREYSSPTVYKLDAVKVSDTQKEDSGEENSSSAEENPVKTSYYVSKSKHTKPKKVPSQEYRESKESEEDDYVVKHVSPKHNSKNSDTQKKESSSYNYQVPSDDGNSRKTYGFQPIDYDKYRQQASENVEKLTDCEEVKKDGNMKCVVCKDPKTGSKSEQCSYSSASEPQAYFVSKTSKYTQPRKEINERFKRYTPREERDAKDFDPYENFKSESRKQYSAAPEDDFFKEYKFPTDYFSGDTLEKSESETHAEKLMKDGGSCKEVKKDGMTCKVCKNDKSGGSFESCSYSSAPTEKKYAYVSEKKSDGNGQPQEKITESRSEPKERKQELKASESVNEEIKKKEHKESKIVNDSPYEIPKHFADETKRHEEDRSKYDNSKEDDRKESQPTDEYYHKVFKSRPEKQEENQRYNSEESKDVEKVLEEFSKKDRSTCKKAIKDGMTCYLCVNKDGTQHEECMFVAGSEPKKSHVAYHEVEQFKNKNNPATAASSVREVTLQKHKKRPVKKAFTNTQTAQSVKVTTRAKFTPTYTAALINGKFRQPRKLRRTQNYSGLDAIVEETRNQPVSLKFKVAAAQRKSPDNVGAGSETKLVFSKELGIRLPKYFLEQSAFEKRFYART